MSKAVPSVSLAGLVGSSNACNSRDSGVILSWKFWKPNKHTLFPILSFQRWHFSLSPWKDRKEITDLVMFFRLPKPESECRYGFTEKRVFKQDESSSLLENQKLPVPTVFSFNNATSFTVNVTWWVYTLCHRGVGSCLLCATESHHLWEGGQGRDPNTEEALFSL